jgi:hypothetical protein
LGGEDKGATLFPSMGIAADITARLKAVSSRKLVELWRSHQAIDELAHHTATIL